MPRPRRVADAAAHLDQALRILDQMDDRITEHGGDDDERGRRELAKIRRAKAHIRKALR
jgi:hypothetical protein